MFEPGLVCVGSGEQRELGCSARLLLTCLEGGMVSGFWDGVGAMVAV